MARQNTACEPHEIVDRTNMYRWPPLTSYECVHVVRVCLTKAVRGWNQRGEKTGKHPWHDN